MDDKEALKPAMIAEGYAVVTANKPSLVTQTKSWKELLEQHLPESKLTAKHDQLLNSEKDETAIKALDMAYKLRGSYAPERSLNVSVTLKPQEHVALANEYEAKLLESISSMPPEASNSPVVERESDEPSADKARG